MFEIIIGLMSLLVIVLSFCSAWFFGILPHIRSSAVSSKKTISSSIRISSLSYDPEDSILLSLHRFKTVTANTECIFARKAKLWGSCPWVETITLEENVLRNLEAFRASVRHARQGMDELHNLLLPRKKSPWEDLSVFIEKMKQVRKLAISSSSSPPFAATSQLRPFKQFIQQILKPEDVRLRRATEIFMDRIDGFVLEIPGSQYSSDIRLLSQTVHNVLATLTREDSYSKTGGELFQSLNPSPSWNFSFEGEVVNVTTFAPCYPETNSRYQFSDDSNCECCYMLFQPESTFHFLDPGPGRINSQMDWQHPISNREKIRCLYRRNGREYKIAETDDGALPSTETIVRPLYMSQRAIKWWKLDPFS